MPSDVLVYLCAMNSYTVSYSGADMMPLRVCFNEISTYVFCYIIVSILQLYNIVHIL